MITVIYVLRVGLFKNARSDVFVDISTSNFNNANTQSGNMAVSGN